MKERKKKDCNCDGDWITGTQYICFPGSHLFPDIKHPVT